MRVGTCPATAIANPRWRGAQQAQEAGDPPLVNKAEERCSTVLGFANYRLPRYPASVPPKRFGPDPWRGQGDCERLRR